MSDIRILPFGSGSTGNCFYIELGGHRLLIDLGIGYRRVKRVLELYGIGLSEIEAVFVTHGHSDHVKASEVMGKHLSCQIYTNESAAWQLKVPERRFVFLPFEETSEVLPGLQVTMFKVPHDFKQTCGFAFRCEGKKIVYVTDCGRMSARILDHLKGADVAILEANHDVDMLKNGPYPYFLQQRILSAHGHMSNEECGETVRKLYESGTKNFLLAHLSRHNNTPGLALDTVSAYLEGREAFLYACPDEGEDLLEF